MKILMLTDVYFPRINGVSTSIATFREAFAALGHHVTLIAPHYPARYQDDADVIRIASRYVPRDPEDRMLKYRKVLALKEYLRDQHYDILHIQTPFLAHYLGLKLARYLAIPSVESYHTYFEEYLFHYLPFLPATSMRAVARRFSRQQCNSVDAIIVPSTAMLEVLRSYAVTTPMHIIPTGIHFDDFAKGDGLSLRKRLGIDAQTPVLSYVGRVAHEKNLDFLLHVLQRVRKQHPDVVLLIAGDGPAMVHIKKLAARLSVSESIRLLGYLDRRTQLADFYHCSDVFVFASRTETQGLVLLEAMASGVPVVALSMMGTRDILMPQRGTIIAADDVADFAYKVDMLLQDKNKRMQLAHDARIYAKGWSIPETAQKTLDLYAEVIAKR